MYLLKLRSLVHVLRCCENCDDNLDTVESDIYMKLKYTNVYVGSGSRGHMFKLKYHIKIFTSLLLFDKLYKHR